jgi:fatty acid desaturase
MVSRGDIMMGEQSSHHVFQFRSWSHRQTAYVRVGVGIWLLLLSAILYRAGVGGPWEWPLVAVAVLHFGLAYRLFRVAKHDPDASLRFR